ncbi:putative cyclase [Exidia glandulosa HHB12029]|uniref:Putative cyclase n=1 Tax=Exidia glandulosa HHB12029 TaxID=1314781 RepID=A0A165DS72_EXIGL|nr:putative cyclase [Exidia glandulosa HHB12029]
MSGCPPTLTMTRTRTFVDLSHPLSSTTPVYPGDPVTFSSKPGFTHEHDGCALTILSLGTHTGTHLDAPSHFVPNGATAHELDLSHLVAPMYLLDLRALIGVQGEPRRKITWADLAPWHAHIASCGTAGGILVLRTGWSQYFTSKTLDAYIAHPYISLDAAEGIVRSGVRVLGVDTFSPDETSGDPPTDFGAHRVLLGAKDPCIIVENLRLEGLDGIWKEGEDWTISVLPLHLEGLDGSPVRAVAWKA